MQEKKEAAENKELAKRMYLTVLNSTGMFTA